MKNAASLLRQKTSCSIAQLVEEELTLGSSSLDEREVDLFERRPPHLEPLELLAARERVRRQLVRARASARSCARGSPRRSGGSGSRPRGRRSSARAASRCVTICPSRRTATRSASCSRLVEVVRRQQHGLAERAQRADHLPRGAARRRVEAGRRLVEEDEIGIADERDAEVEPALLAAGERLHARVALLGEPDELDHLVDVARRARSSRRTSRCVSRTVRFGQSSDCWSTTPMRSRNSGPGRCGSCPSTRHLARVAVAVALEDLDRRRLAGAVRAEQAEDLAFARSSKSMPRTASSSP